MTEEDKKAIEYIEGFIGLFYEYPNPTGVLVQDYEVKNFETILNLIKSQQEEIEKLKNKNKDLLRKLRNRVKEVKKLIKYSSYKKEFSRLNRELEKKNKIIDIMAEFIDENIDDCLLNILNIDEPCENYVGKNKKLCKYCIKQYFKIKVEGKQC